MLSSVRKVATGNRIVRLAVNGSWPEMPHPGHDASESEWFDTLAITRGSSILTMICRATFCLATALLTLLYPARRPLDREHLLSGRHCDAVPMSSNRPCYQDDLALNHLLAFLVLQIHAKGYRAEGRPDRKPMKPNEVYPWFRNQRRQRGHKLHWAQNQMKNAIIVGGLKSDNHIDVAGQRQALL